MTLLDVIDFLWNVNGKFYVTNQIFWAMGENRRSFGLEVIRKSKLKKKQQKKKMI